MGASAREVEGRHRDFLQKSIECGSIALQRWTRAGAAGQNRIRRRLSLGFITTEIPAMGTLTILVNLGAIHVHYRYQTALLIAAGQP
jgi:hypothetical protein